MIALSPSQVRLLVTRLLVLAVAVTAVFLLLTSADAGQPPPTTTHVVAQGETLWELASVVAPAGADLREVVRDIQQLNDLPGATIYPGQRLQLPVG